MHVGGERLDVARADRAAHAGRRERRREVDPRGPRARVRAAHHRGVEQPGQPEVAGVERLAARPGEAVRSRRRTADDVERALPPLLERVLVDDEEDLLEPPFDLLLRADQSRHVRIASSIFG